MTAARASVVDVSHRELRVDLSEVDNETAKRLLREYEAAIVVAVDKHWCRVRHAFFVATREELLATAQSAVLEAWVTYDVGDVTREKTLNGGLRSHVNRVVGWRVAEYVTLIVRGLPRSQRADLLAAMQYVDTDQSSDFETNTSRFGHCLPDTNQPLADEAHYTHSVRVWLRQRIGRLPPRQRIIFSEILRGEKQAKIGESLGIRETRVYQEYFAGLQQLRKWAKEDGIDSIEWGAT